MSTISCYEPTCNNEIEVSCSCTSFPIYSCSIHFVKHCEASNNPHNFVSIFLKPLEDTKSAILSLLKRKKLKTSENKKWTLDSFYNIIDSLENVFEEIINEIDYDSTKIEGYFDKVCKTQKLSKLEKDPVLSLLAFKSCEAVEKAKNIFQKNNPELFNKLKNEIHVAIRGFYENQQLALKYSNDATRINPSLEESRKREKECMRDLKSQKKKFYKEEMKRMEAKIHEEKEIADKKYKSICEKYEERLREEAEFSDIKEQYEREKQILIEKFEAIKQSYQKINDEFTQKKRDFKIEMALLQQENEFKVKSISSDLEKSLQEAEEKYNETLKSLKEESEEELSKTIKKLIKEKEILEKQLNQKENSLKELAKNISSLEQEKTHLAERLANLLDNKQNIEAKLRADIDYLQTQLKAKKDSESAEKISIYLENERVKGMLQEMEKDMSEKNSAFERERILWENKFSFLTQLRDSAKSDLAESQRKFDITVENLRNRSAVEKEKQESSTDSLISSIQTRFITQIKDMQESHAAILNETLEKNKILERNLRALNEELEILKRGRSSEAGILEKRIKELSENEQRLFVEIDALKKDRNRKIDELTESASYEREQLNTKLADYEKRAKEAENQKSQLVLDFNKERSQWHMDKDRLISQKNEALDSLEIAEKKREILVREIEKLRAEKGRRTAGLFAGANLGDDRFRRGVGKTEGISFEEFAKEKESQDTSENSSPKNPNQGITIPIPPPINARSPISSRNHRSSSEFDFNIEEKRQQDPQ